MSSDFRHCAKTVTLVEVKYLNRCVSILLQLTLRKKKKERNVFINEHKNAETNH